MRSFVTLTLSAAVLAQQLVTDSYSERSATGALVETQMRDDHIFKTITLPLEPYHQDFN
jgi:hypothetical protein